MGAQTPVVITCGPSWEPVDQMRRLTNASTGTLGAALASAFASAGFAVHLFRGEGATTPPPPTVSDPVPFGTNEDLARALANLAQRVQPAAVLHAAALCDFRVAATRHASGQAVDAAKISSREGRVILELEPATKVLPQLRTWFPAAWIVGWKYELSGDRPAALAAARRQFREAQTDACVLNGRAWGDGFALCEPPDRVEACPDAAALAAALIARLQRRHQGQPGPAPHP